MRHFLSAVCLSASLHNVYYTVDAQEACLLKPLGMTLTSYLMQTVLILAAAHLLDWHEQAHSLFLLGAAVCLLVVQAAASSIWLRFFQIGPFEYIWRLGTHGKAIPSRK